MNSFESKRLEVLKRRDLIEKQRIDKITQKIKEKDKKLEKIKKNKEEIKAHILHSERSSTSRKCDANSRGRYDQNFENDDNNQRVLTQSKDTSFEQTPIVKPSKLYLRNDQECLEKNSCSPTIIGVSPPNYCYSPDTPDYCPIINAENRREGIIQIQSFDEITELPLDFEEDRESLIKLQIQDVSKINKGLHINSPQQYLNSSRVNRILKSCDSNESLARSKVQVNTETILKAFKNSPCSDMITEYFKNKSIMERKHELSRSNSKHKI